uniref:RRM domain-containing protein n=1 Tax=Anas zonorhyncha TaxID=75864 RepID=A0A8B9VJZ9_9AVES
MLARYVPNKGVTGDPHLTLFVARLNLQTTEEKLKEVFSRYGDIRKIRLVRDLVTGFSKGYAFIEFYFYLFSEDCCVLGRVFQRKEVTGTAP